ncbi:eukaryotic translation initiation factor SUI1 family protein [Collybia nuda]|uniref:Eukaryotic translation initiation factor SUI1 family protein n=1 Tax=Collybia nuda TaxID=64659 RepID=A0A9P5Y917_9AGAR|nr:eukaryotic translation initiation factor SUI1 family protein [Collybia nuda]
MFKKPLSGLKTSAPLRSSDRRKLKQKVVAAFGISSEDGDLLVPEGLLSVKFNTHLDEPGVAYLAPDGDPLWFSVGKGSDDLVPTIYTLWKQRELLPFISTPAPVIPILVGGADLMIPGVIHHPSSLSKGHLVSIMRYNNEKENPSVSPPLAVGRMALPSDQLRGGKEKGKAVLVYHTWKDHLWEMGSKGDVPEPTPLMPATVSPPTSEDVAGGSVDAGPTPPIDAMEALNLDTASATATASGKPNEPPYSAQEISDLLHLSLLQVISATIPASSFPIPSTVLYTNYILPCRPAFPASVLPPSSPSDTLPSSQDINIKASSHKSLTTFLKSAEKSSILTLKSPQKHSQQSDLLVVSVNMTHPAVVGHHRYLTLKEMEERAAKKAQKAEKARELLEGGGEVEVKELWKPHQATLDLFEGMGANTTALYSLTEVKAALNDYINSNSLINVRDQAYINLDALLVACLSAKSKGKPKGKDIREEALGLEFMKREELTKQITAKMQSWYEVVAGGQDPVRKKGALKPVQVVTKIRQGRKASTLITGFEPFLVVNADDMAEELRKVCAGATSISPIAGKPANSGLEVLVQGKQSKAVVDYLTGQGIPKRWIEVHDLSGKK